MKADVRLRIRALVDAVIAGREDAVIVRRVLTVMLETAVMDFERYHDSRHAANRVRDFDILNARNKAAKRSGKPV